MGYESKKLKSSVKSKYIILDKPTKDKLKFIETTPFANPGRFASFNESKAQELTQKWEELYIKGDQVERGVAIDRLYSSSWNWKNGRKISYDTYHQLRINPEDPRATARFGYIIGGSEEHDSQFDGWNDESFYNYFIYMPQIEFYQFIDSMFNQVDESMQEGKYLDTERYLNYLYYINGAIRRLRKKGLPQKQKSYGKPTKEQMDKLQRYADKHNLEIYNVYITKKEGDTGGHLRAVLYSGHPDDPTLERAFFYNNTWRRSAWNG